MTRLFRYGILTTLRNIRKMRGSTSVSRNYVSVLILALTTLTTLLTAASLLHLLPRIGTSLQHATRFLRTACRFPVVYNDPPGASRTLTNALDEWVMRTRRPRSECGTTALVTLAVLPECVARQPDVCSVVAAPVVLSESAREFLHTRMPDYRLVTSTRHPVHRLLAEFQRTDERDEDTLAAREDALRQWLTALNPWRLFNFHTGEERTGTCPLTDTEIRRAFNAVTSFHVVIDAALRSESNAILKHHGLFTLPEIGADDGNSGDIEGVADAEVGAWAIALPDDLRALFKSKMCVEVELHKAFQTRMASLYEVATGKKCLSHGNRKELTSCIEGREREVLNQTGSWLF